MDSKSEPENCFTRTTLEGLKPLFWLQKTSHFFASLFAQISTLFALIAETITVFAQLCGCSIVSATSDLSLLGNRAGWLQAERVGPISLCTVWGPESRLFLASCFVPESPKSERCQTSQKQSKAMTSLWLFLRHSGAFRWCS